MIIYSMWSYVILWCFRLLYMSASFGASHLLILLVPPRWLGDRCKTGEHCWHLRYGQKWLSQTKQDQGQSGQIWLCPEGWCQEIHSTSYCTDLLLDMEGGLLAMIGRHSNLYHFDQALHGMEMLSAEDVNEVSGSFWTQVPFWFYESASARARNWNLVMKTVRCLRSIILTCGGHLGSFFPHIHGKFNPDKWKLWEFRGNFHRSALVPFAEIISGSLADQPHSDSFVVASWFSSSSGGLDIQVPSIWVVGPVRGFPAYMPSTRSPVFLWADAFECGSWLCGSLPVKESWCFEAHEVSVWLCFGQLVASHVRLARHDKSAEHRTFLWK